MLSTKPYKGSRDFYPEEMRSREWIFSKLSKTAELFGYEKVDAPLIEPVDLYLAKTSEEIVNQQIYSFEDRGGRQVAIRPEMTPTVSRMIAARYRELVKPIRWYSIPNLWRYERPGKGRLREHWQLNCDLFAAADEFLADLEILSLAMEIPLAFDAPLGSFRLYINHRKILNAFLEKFLQIPKEKHAPVARLMDKKEKLPKETWLAALQEEGLLQEQAEKIAQYMESGISFLKEHKDNLDKEAIEYLLELLAMLQENGYADFFEYNPAIVRGFDYYTGMVFELFDTHPENRRSLFGGGRYDNLVGNFIKESVNAVGFGMGDVTFTEFLKNHGLYKEFPVSIKVFIPVFPERKQQLAAHQLAKKLRQAGIATEVSCSPVKLKKQFSVADNRGIRYVLILGEDEMAMGEVSLKNLETGKQEKVSMENITQHIV